MMHGELKYYPLMLFTFLPVFLGQERRKLGQNRLFRNSCSILKCWLNISFRTTKVEVDEYVLKL